MVDTSKKSRQKFLFTLWAKSVPYLYLAVLVFPAISLGRRRARRSQGPPTDDLRICARLQKEESQGCFSHCQPDQSQNVLSCSQIGQICFGNRYEGTMNRCPPRWKNQCKSV